MPADIDVTTKLKPEVKVDGENVNNAGVSLKNIAVSNVEHTLRLSQINVSAAYSYLSALTRGQDELSSGLAQAQSVLKRYVATLASDPERAVNASPAPKDKPLLSLVGMVLSKDAELQEQIANDLTERTHIVKTADAVEELKSYCDTLPRVLQESNEPGRALMRYMCELVVNLTTSDNISPATSRLLARQNIFAPDGVLTSRGAKALSSLLSATVDFIRANQPDVIQSLGRNAARLIVPTTNDAEIGEYIRTAIEDIPVDDDTYLNIFKNDNDFVEDETAERIIKRVSDLINKAAGIAREAHLIGNESNVSLEDENITSDTRALTSREQEISKEVALAKAKSEAYEEARNREVEQFFRNIDTPKNNTTTTNQIASSVKPQEPLCHSIAETLDGTQNTGSNLVQSVATKALAEAVLASDESPLTDNPQVHANNTSANIGDLGSDIDLISEFENFSLPETGVKTGAPLTNSEAARINSILSDVVAKAEHSNLFGANHAQAVKPVIDEAVAQVIRADKQEALESIKEPKSSTSNVANTTVSGKSAEDVNNTLHPNDLASNVAQSFVKSVNLNVKEATPDSLYAQQQLASELKNIEFESTRLRGEVPFTGDVLDNTSANNLQNTNDEIIYNDFEVENDKVLDNTDEGARNLIQPKNVSFSDEEINMGKKPAVDLNTVEETKQNLKENVIRPTLTAKVELVNVEDNSAANAENDINSLPLKSVGSTPKGALDAIQQDTINTVLNGEQKADDIALGNLNKPNATVSQDIDNAYQDPSLKNKDLGSKEQIFGVQNLVNDTVIEEEFDSEQLPKSVDNKLENHELDSQKTYTLSSKAPKLNELQIENNSIEAAEEKVNKDNGTNSVSKIDAPSDGEKATSANLDTEISLKSHVQTSAEPVIVTDNVAQTSRTQGLIENNEPTQPKNDWTQKNQTLEPSNLNDLLSVAKDNLESESQDNGVKGSTLDFNVDDQLDASINLPPSTKEDSSLHASALGELFDEVYKNVTVEELNGEPRNDFTIVNKPLVTSKTFVADSQNLDEPLLAEEKGTNNTVKPTDNVTAKVLEEIVSFEDEMTNSNTVANADTSEADNLAKVSSDCEAIDKKLTNTKNTEAQLKNYLASLVGTSDEQANVDNIINIDKQVAQRNGLYDALSNDIAKNAKASTLNSEPKQETSQLTQVSKTHEESSVDGLESELITKDPKTNNTDDILPPIVGKTVANIEAEQLQATNLADEQGKFNTVERNGSSKVLNTAKEAFFNASLTSEEVERDSLDTSSNHVTEPKEIREKDSKQLDLMQAVTQTGGKQADAKQDGASNVQVEIKSKPSWLTGIKHNNATLNNTPNAKSYSNLQAQENMVQSNNALPHLEIESFKDEELSAPGVVKIGGDEREHSLDTLPSSEEEAKSTITTVINKRYGTLGGPLNVNNAPSSMAVNTSSISQQQEITKNKDDTALNNSNRPSGILGRLSGFFKRSKVDDIPAKQEVVGTIQHSKSPIVDDSSSKVSGFERTLFTPEKAIGMSMDDMVAQLNLVRQDPDVPPEVRKMASSIHLALTNPLGDLQAVSAWLGLVTAPLNAQGPRAQAMQQWALMLLSIRFKQLGKSVNKFTKSEAFNKLLEGLKVDSHAKWPQNLLDETMQQIERLQTLSSSGQELGLPSFIPLPPSYSEGREGGLGVEKHISPDGIAEWKLKFFFELKDLGPLEIRTALKGLDIKMQFVAETQQALAKISATALVLKERFNECGFNVTKMSPRLGKVYPPTTPTSVQALGNERSLTERDGLSFNV